MSLKLCNVDKKLFYKRVAVVKNFNVQKKKRGCIPKQKLIHKGYAREVESP